MGRSARAEAYAEGFRATAMSRDGWYRLTRHPAPTTRGEDPRP
ncbi:hypothetical protein ACWEWX_38760 [Streptomyces asiaticus]